jgi:hypothetical protein
MYLGSKILGGFLLMFLFVSCGNRPQIVKNVKFTPQTIENQVWGKMNVEMGIGNVTFPNLTLPIIHPQSWQNLGSFSLTSYSDKNFIEVNVNLSELARIDATYAKLPNGSSLPLMGSNLVIDIPIGNAKSVHLYLAGSESKFAMGVSILFSTLDNLGAKIGYSSFFPVFNLGQISGSAGVFTSPQAGENGFGFFADFSQVIPQSLKSNLYVAPTTLKLSNQIPAQESVINDELYHLHRKGKKLQLKR